MPVARQILSYFLHNPGAADSLMEIARWRLMQEKIRLCVEETNEALQWLTAQNFLCKETRLGTESLFLLNQERRAAALSFVEEEARSTDP